MNRNICMSAATPKTAKMSYAHTYGCGWCASPGHPSR